MTQQIEYRFLLQHHYCFEWKKILFIKSRADYEELYTTGSSFGPIGA